MLLKSTTRHIHIFAAEVQNNELIPSESVLTLDVDPDNELNWTDDTLQKVYRKFDELVEAYTGEELTDYNLRRIGSDLEHFVRSLLQKGEISYNLKSRVLNYSMGLPQVVSDENPNGAA
jgi:NAD(P)H-quinone oxidoreductase subunit M